MEGGFIMWRRLTRRAAVAVAALLCAPALLHAQAAAKKPHIVIIWGDDVGQANLSAYTFGLMGYP
jgi:arylsulfatase